MEKNIGVYEIRILRQIGGIGMDIKFEGYWSDKDKKLWKSIDWKANNYKDYPVEDEEPVNGIGYFYTANEVLRKPIKLIKYIRANPIFGPYYGPAYTSEILDFMKLNSFCYPMYDGRMKDSYKVFDRFENTNLADALSR